MAFADDLDASDDDDGYRGRTVPWPHSGVGIASFIAGILALLLLLTGFALAAFVAATGQQTHGEPPPVVVLCGLLILGAALVALVGSGLGIGGVCQSRRKKVFAIIGLCMNAMILLGGIGIVLVGFFA